MSVSFYKLYSNKSVILSAINNLYNFETTKSEITSWSWDLRRSRPWTRRGLEIILFTSEEHQIFHGIFIGSNREGKTFSNTSYISIAIALCATGRSLSLTTGGSWASPKKVIRSYFYNREVREYVIRRQQRYIISKLLQEIIVY